MDKVISFDVRNKGLWGFISSMFGSGYSKRFKTDLDDIEIMKIVKDAIDEKMDGRE